MVWTRVLVRVAPALFFFELGVAHPVTSPPEALLVHSMINLRRKRGQSNVQTEQRRSGERT